MTEPTLAPAELATLTHQQIEAAWRLGFGHAVNAEVLNSDDEWMYKGANVIEDVEALAGEPEPTLDALKVHAIEELCQLGYRVEGSLLFPPDHLNALMRAAGHPLAAISFPEEIAVEPVQPITAAARDVLAERQRQISVEGWTPEHDDEHAGGSLAVAAACYAAFSNPRGSYTRGNPPPIWPWASEWWRPSEDELRNLAKAGALILAEMERRYRAATKAEAAPAAPSLPSPNGEKQG